MNLLVRADATAAIGSGHVIRSLALAEAWRRGGGAARFLSAELDPSLERDIAARGFPVQQLPGAYPDPADLQSTLLAADEAGTEAWIVVDGYRFTSEYHAALRGAGRLLMVIDDYAHLDYYDADVLLNQNVDAESLVYHGPPEMRTLLGPGYALLRGEFLGPGRPLPPVPALAARVLVMMGGGDPDNVTGKVLEALADPAMTGHRVRVVVGPSNPNAPRVSAGAQRLSPPAEVLPNPPQMPAVMRWADLAVTAAGSTCWELAYLGVPMVTIVTADNQRGIAQGLAARGASMNLGWHSTVTPEAIRTAVTALAGDAARRARLRDAAAGLVDGNGADRVAAALRRPRP